MVLAYLFFMGIVNPFLEQISITTKSNLYISLFVGPQ